MNTNISSRLVTLIIALTLVACSDDSPTGGNTRDITPPQLVSVNPIDEFHVDVTFNEAVTRASAETRANYEIVIGPSVAAADPGDPLYVTTAILRDDQKTVSLVTYNSMSGHDLALSVRDVSDEQGNASPGIEESFIGSTLPDDDPPVIIRTTPEEGSSDSPIKAYVTIKFSEPIDEGHFERGTTWTSPEGPVRFYRGGLYYSDTRYTIVAIEPLNHNSLQTITFSGVRDRHGNIMPTSTLTFSTSSVVDNTRPRLVSSYPPNGATNVSLTTRLSLTFSEPMDRTNFRWEQVPDMLFDQYEWSDDGRTLNMTLRDYDPLNENRQYSLFFFPGEVYDLGGNTIAMQSVIFTTGTELERGSIKGRVMGHLGTDAAEPAGTIVFAETWWGSYNFGIAELNDTYVVPNLEWGGYVVHGFLDSNRDGYISVYSGDALGGYGADIPGKDYDLDFIPLPEGRHASEVDFSLFDPTAAYGIVTYTGEPLEPWRPVNVGLFKSRADAMSLTNPVAVSHGSWPYDEVWLFNNFYQDFDEDDYYVAGYIDVDSSRTYDPGTDLVGAYGGISSPTAIHMVGGKDHYVLDIPMGAPTVGASAAMTWPEPRFNSKFRQLADRVSKHQPRSTVLGINAESATRSPQNNR